MNRAIILAMLLTACGPVRFPVEVSRFTSTADGSLPADAALPTTSDAGDATDGNVTSRDAELPDATIGDAGDLDASQLDPDSGVDTSDAGLTSDSGHDGGRRGPDCSSMDASSAVDLDAGCDCLWLLLQESGLTVQDFCAIPGHACDLDAGICCYP